MTVLGSGNDKADDKEQLVSKCDVSVMPDRHRLLKVRRRRSITTLILGIGCLLIFLGGIFLTVCFIKKIGPFRRHTSGFCGVGNSRYNGRHEILESYEITDKYVLMRIPALNTKHGTFESVRILRVLDKNVTVLRHNGVCYVKPTMKYQALREDWFDRIGILSLHRYRTPDRFEHCHFRIIRPQLPRNYLKEEVHHMADTMCLSHPVFRLEFKEASNPIPLSHLCKNFCGTCALQNRSYKPTIVNGLTCMECICDRSQNNGALRWKSLNQVESNCKRVQCKKVCLGDSRIRCFKCRCADSVVDGGVKKKSPRVINTFKLDPLIIHGNDAHDPRSKEGTTGVPPSEDKRRFQPIFGTRDRSKRSIRNCMVRATIFEGYTPLDHEVRVPLDYVHDC